jgi:hypothetical protein
MHASERVIDPPPHVAEHCVHPVKRYMNVEHGTPEQSFVRAAVERGSVAQ